MLLQLSPATGQGILMPNADNADLHCLLSQSLVYCKIYRRTVEYIGIL